MSSAQSLPQFSSIESTHNHPVTVAADTPEHLQPGTIPIPPILGVQERSATLESMLETLNRASMLEHPTLDHTPPRAVANRSQESIDHQHVQPVIPDPTIPRILAFFGYGRNKRVRKELVSVIWALAVDFSQIVAIITLLTISAHNKSPTIPNLNEWDACDKPLGVWNALWIVLLSFDVWLTIWGSRERIKLLQGTAQRNANNPFEDPYPRVYNRLSLLSFTLRFVWFVLAQIFVYSSTKTCRHSSPHLWWLTFGLLSVMYLTILQIVVFDILVQLVGPILSLFWVLLLLSLGRHHFTPEIGQVPRSVVDKLPLVLYIPPPPDQPPKPFTTSPGLHTYPPKPDPPRRFRFFPRRTGTGKGKGGSKRPLTWEDNWERGEHPFVRLDGHRASCAICLLDFQEPKRVGEGASKTVEDKPNSEAQAPGENEAVAEVNEATSEGEEEVEELREVTEQTTIESPSLNGDNLRLQDAGEGAQPLRLLQCGHVFHKTCVDPWLLNVSGRCPVCQRPVRGNEPAAGTGHDTRPSRRRWFRRSRRRGPA